MLAFVLGAVALVALALAFVLPTLWKDARQSAIAMLVALPLAAVALYAGFGTPDALDPANRTVPESIEQAVAQLERRLEREPDSLEGWVLLGRTRKNQGRETAAAGDFAAAMPHFASAAAAFRKARDIAPHEPDLLVETAEAISLSNAERAFGAEGTALLDEVTISADADALAALPPQAVVFVFARNADAPGPPVAARRVPAARLPMTITLSDADRLMPTATLSARPRVEVSARFARSGAVTPEAGDLVAPPVIVELANAAPIALTLSPADAPTDAARAPTFAQ